jgi:hypothetical protein
MWPVWPAFLQLRLNCSFSRPAKSQPRTLFNQTRLLTFLRSRRGIHQYLFTCRLSGPPQTLRFNRWNPPPLPHTHTHTHIPHHPSPHPTHYHTIKFTSSCFYFLFDFLFASCLVTRALRMHRARIESPFLQRHYNRDVFLFFLLPSDRTLYIYFYTIDWPLRRMTVSSYASLRKERKRKSLKFLLPLK